MSGIFGVWHLDGRPVVRAAVEESLAQMAHRGPDGTRVSLLDFTAFGCALSRVTVESGTESQPLTFENLTGVLDGRLDNRTDLIAELHDHPLCAAGCPDLNLVLAAYDRFGEAFADRIEGDFALAIFDARSQRLTLARDRIGLRPLCYAQSSNAFFFASDAKAILTYPGLAKTPDEEMLAEFILYYPSARAQTRTFFRDIHSLAPAHLATIDRQRIAVRRYFELDGARPVRMSSFREYAEAFGDLFKRAVRKRLRSAAPVAISVSGGLDSSFLFCVADRMAGREPGLAPSVFGVNFGGAPGTGSDETEYLDHLRRACSAEIERIDQVPGLIETAAAEAWSSETPDIDGGATLHRFMRRARERGARLALTGHWGDQLLVAWDYLADLLLEGRLILFANHLRAWRLGMIGAAAGVLRNSLERGAPEPMRQLTRQARIRFDGPWKAPWFTPRFRELLASRFTAERLPAVRASNHGWSIYKQCRLSYQVHCMEWNSRVAGIYGLEKAFPYLDREVIEFLMNLPGEVQAHAGVPRNLMREAMRGVAPDAIANRRSKGVFTHLVNDSIERDFGRIAELLGPDSMAAQMGFLDGPVLAGLLGQWRAQNRVSDDSIIASRITDLCGMEVFLRQFFGDAARLSVIA